jgi:transcriptional regulator with XRE-family HTH domain
MVTGKYIQVHVVTEEATKAAIGARVREARRAVGLTQGELTHLIGELDNNKVSRWERGHHLIGVPELAKIAMVTGASMLYLAVGAESRPSLEKWLTETALGQEAQKDPEAVHHLYEVPTHGREAADAFWEFSYQGYKHGLSPRESGRLAATTLRALD